METIVKNNEMVLGLNNLFGMAMPKSNYTKWYAAFKEDREPKKYIYNLINNTKESTGFKSMDVLFDEEKEIIKINEIEDLFGKQIIHISTKRTVEFETFTSLILLAINEESSLAYTKMENYNVESEDFEYEMICEEKREIWDGLEKITGLDYYQREEGFESARFTNEFENNMIIKIAGKEYIIDVL
jgi:uncharacterized protein YbcV (DUF1398 family)